MNIERLTKLAEWLEGGAKHERIAFDMMNGLIVYADDPPTNVEEFNQCGSTCCIAGAAVQFFNDPFLMLSDHEADEIIDTGETELPWNTVAHKARELLDLTEEQARPLFEPWHNNEPSWSNDPQHAGRTIRHLIETGEVDWKAT